MRAFPRRLFRIVSCVECWWRDFYLSHQSYPPRCPKCGKTCSHEWSAQERHMSKTELRLFGKDDGLRWDYKAPGVPLRRAKRSGWV